MAPVVATVINLSVEVLAPSKAQGLKWMISFPGVDLSRPSFALAVDGLARIVYMAEHEARLGAVDPNSELDLRIQVADLNLNRGIKILRKDLSSLTASSFEQKVASCNKQLDILHAALVLAMADQSMAV